MQLNYKEKRKKGNKNSGGNESSDKKPCGITSTDNDGKKDTEVKLVWSLTLALRATDGGNREYNCRWNETLVIALEDKKDNLNCGYLRNDNHEQQKQKGAHC